MTDRIRYTFDEAAFVPDENRLTIDDRELVLEQKVSDLLHAFCRRPGQVLTKQWLLEEIWPHRIVNEDSLSVAISKLRRLLQDSRGKPRYIKTITGTGYVWLPAVEQTEASAPEQPVPVDSRTSSRRKIATRWVPVMAMALVLVAVVYWLGQGGDTGADAEHSLPEELSQINEQARSQLQSENIEQLRQAVTNYRLILGEYPDFIEGYLGIAEAKLGLSAQNGHLELDLYANEVHALLDHVLAEQPDNARAWLLKAEVSFLGDWDLVTAEAAYKKAIRHEPENPENYLPYTEFLITRGEFERAEAVLMQLRASNPAYYRYLNMSFVYMMRGELELALAEATRLLNSEAESDSFHKIIHRVSLMLDDHEAAFSALKEILHEQGISPKSIEAYEAIYRNRGIKALFEHFLIEQLDTNIGHYQPPIAWARYAVVIGDNEAALKWLARAIDVKQPQALLIRVDPHYLPLRNLDGFRKLLERLPE